MSKRFGRNQKRKLNAALKVAQRDLSIASESLALVRLSAERDANSVKIMHELFGIYCMALEPKKIKVGDEDIDRGYFEMPQLQHFDHESLLQNIGESISEATFRRLNLQIVESKCFEDFMANKVHLLLETRSGRVAYAATPQAIASMRRDDLVRHIVTPMCSKLISKFKGIKNDNKVL